MSSCYCRNVATPFVACALVGQFIANFIFSFSAIEAKAFSCEPAHSATYQFCAAPVTKLLTEKLIAHILFLFGSVFFRLGNPSLPAQPLFINFLIFLCLFVRQPSHTFVLLSLPHFSQILVINQATPYMRPN